MMRIVTIILLTVLALLLLVLAGLRIAAMGRETQSVAELAPQEGRFIATAMGDIFVMERGPADGRPILLIHGSVGWSGFWRPTLETLAASGYRAIAIDMPPMGFSQFAEDGKYARDAQAKRLLALVDALEMRPILLAHSFGAGAAIEALMLQEDAFDAAVIIAGAIGIGQDQAPQTLPFLLRSQALREVGIAASVTNPIAMKPMLRQFLYRKDAATPEIIDILKYPLARQGTTEELARWLPTLLETPRDTLSIRASAYMELTLPVAILWGEKDTATPLEQGEELHDLLAQSTLRVLPDLGHIPQIEDPVAFHRALLEALSDL